MKTTLMCLLTTVLMCWCTSGVEARRNVLCQATCWKNNLICNHDCDNSETQRSGKSVLSCQSECKATLIKCVEQDCLGAGRKVLPGGDDGSSVDNSNGGSEDNGDGGSEDNSDGGHPTASNGNKKLGCLSPDGGTVNNKVIVDAGRKLVEVEEKERPMKIPGKLCQVVCWEKNKVCREKCRGQDQSGTSQIQCESDCEADLKQCVNNCRLK